jgi:hypothetical protein
MSLSRSPSDRIVAFTIAPPPDVEPPSSTSTSFAASFDDARISAL